MSKTKTLAQRFWAKVDATGGAEACWPWQGYILSNGYGQVWGNATPLGAHRVAWELTHGPILKGDGYHGTCVCHRCDNRRCCNPAHLFLGTHAVNMRDKVAKGRSNSKGSTPRSRVGSTSLLSPLELRWVRAWSLAGHQANHLAAKYGISSMLVLKIKHGKVHRSTYE